MMSKWFKLECWIDANCPEAFYRPMFTGEMNEK